MNNKNRIIILTRKVNKVERLVVIRKEFKEHSLLTLMRTGDLQLAVSEEIQI